MVLLSFLTLEYQASSSVVNYCSGGGAACLQGEGAGLPFVIQGPRSELVPYPKLALESQKCGFA